jgi:hypothetical protein
MLALGAADGANFDADSNVPKIGDLSCGRADRVCVKISRRFRAAVGVFPKRPRMTAPITALNPRVGYIDRKSRKVYPWNR